MATVTFAILAGVVWVCKNKCKHTRWAVDSRCMKCSGDDIVTVRERPEGIARI